MAKPGNVQPENCDGSNKTASNFLSKFRDNDTRILNKFTATQFLETWNHFDVDRNGYIEECELDEFLMQFVTSVISGPIGSEVVSEAAFLDMKKDFLDAYDENSDCRIEIGELSQILPTDEEFLVLFQRENPLESSVEFMKVWKEFDKDCSGYIESDELQSFIRYLLTHSKHHLADIESKIEHYADVMLKLFDRDSDGRLQLSEMARLLPIKENYIARPIFNNPQKISYTEMDRIFKKYDDDGNGQMENHELQALLKDLLELCGEKYDDTTLQHFQDIILNEWDVNHDGKISKKELKMILTQHTKLGEVNSSQSAKINLKNDIKNLI